MDTTKKTNSESAAFASIAIENGSGFGQDGLTKLEYFAGLNMQGMMANTHLTESGYIGMAQVAVKQAKVLLDELAKENF